MAKSVVRGKALVAKLRADPEVRDAEALAAYLGRKKKLKQAAKKAKKVVKKAGSATKGGGKPSRITKEQVNSKPWEFSPGQYQSAHGVHQPHIGEISSVQYQGLSKRGQRDYDKKRDAEFQASADIKREWSDKIEQAYKDGKIGRDTPGLSRDARSTIIQSDIRKAEREKKDRLDAALAKNNIDSMGDFKIGDKLYTNIYGDSRVVKKNKKTVKIALLDGAGNARKNRDGSDMTVSVPLKFLQKKKSTEVKA